MLDVKLDIIRYRFSQDERFNVKRPNRRKTDDEPIDDMQPIKGCVVLGLDANKLA